MGWLIWRGCERDNEERERAVGERDEGEKGSEETGREKYLHRGGDEAEAR